MLESMFPFYDNLLMIETDLQVYLRVEYGN